MRSRGSNGSAGGRRGVLEGALRLVAIVSLGALLALALRPRAERHGGTATVRTLDSALVRWTARDPGRATVVLDSSVPAPEQRAWLRALRAAGTTLAWRAGAAVAPLAVTADPIPDPRGGVRVSAAAPVDASVMLADEAGRLDSLRADSLDGGGMVLDVAALSGAVRARGAGTVARSRPLDSLTVRPVLVLGAAGWEAKFLIAALEERGWQVMARLRVAPTADVVQGAVEAIDTARVSAVVVLDSTAAPYAARIARYVESGGGIVLAGASAALSDFSTLRAGEPGAATAGVAGALQTERPRAGLAVIPVARVRPDAVVLERRDGAVVIAARRVGRGRVLQMGYDETWRWRMTGGEGAPEAHREWWSRVVGAVAHAPVVARAQASDVDEAPVAAIHAVLGAPAELPHVPSEGTDLHRLELWLFALALAALLGEWSSRRLRGAR